LDHYLVTALRQLQAARLATVPAGSAVTGFLLTNRRGLPLSPGYLTHTFRRLTDRAGLPPIRLHDLRHGAASLSLAAGNDLKVVQELLRHGSIVLTADTYTSVLPCLAHRAAEVTAKLVLGAPHPSRRAGRRPRQGRAGRPVRGASSRTRTATMSRSDASGTTRSVPG
jgi:integrase